MTKGNCEKADCTVAATGKCLLSQPDPALCAHFIPDEELTNPLVQKNPPTQTPVEREETKKLGRKFHSGNELGTEDAAEVMRARYCHLIGVLGVTDAGKTCFLSSLYLTASAGKLPDPYRFAGSLSLQAFEDRARGLREWKDGRLPDQLVDHTVLSDSRQPSLLHLAIRRSDAERRRFDLLLTDLPGEWTKNLIMRQTGAEAFKFLQRADGVILVVDGNRLLSDQRHDELEDMRYFSERLATDVKVPKSTPFVVLVTKCDEFGGKMPPVANDLREHIRGLGFGATAILCSAFSRNPEQVQSGTGVFAAIEAVLTATIRERYGDDGLLHGQPRVGRVFQEFRA